MSREASCVTLNLLYIHVYIDRETGREREKDGQLDREVGKQVDRQINGKSFHFIDICLAVLDVCYSRTKKKVSIHFGNLHHSYKI